MIDPFAELDPRFAPYNQLDHETEFSQPDNATKEINDFLRQLVVRPMVAPKQRENNCAPINIRNYR